MKRVGAIALVCAMVVISASCGSDDSDSSAAETTAASTATTGATATTAAATTTAPDPGCTAARKGGELHFGVGSLMARGLDPTVALGSGTAGASEIGALFDELMRYDTKTGKFEPQLAASLTGNADSTKWTLKLRPGVKFGNGDPLTTAAVAFSLDRLKKSTVSAAGMAVEITSTDIVDDLTIVYNLRQSWGGFPYFLSTEGGMIVNPTVVTAKGDQFSLDPTGGGVGPYEFQSFTPNVEIVLKAKTDYWGGPVCIDTIKFTQVQGGQGTYEAFKAGELDTIMVLEANVIADMKADKVDLASTINGGGSTLLLNSGRGDKPVLADLRLRQAISMAVDPKVVNDRVYGGNGVIGTGVAAKAQRIYPGVDGLPYDPAKAKTLVDAAKAEGFNGSVRITCPDTPASTELTITVAAMLQAVGFTVVTENLPSAQSNQKVLFDGNYDIGCGSVSAFDEGPVRGLNQFLSDSPRNRVGYKDPNMDAAIKSLYQAANPEAVVAAVKSIQTVWNNTATSMNLLAGEWVVGWDDKVHNLVMTREAAVLFDKAWMDK